MTKQTSEFRPLVLGLWFHLTASERWAIILILLLLLVGFSMRAWHLRSARTSHQDATDAQRNVSTVDSSTLR